TGGRQRTWTSGPRPRTPQGPGCPSASRAATPAALVPGHAAWPEALQTRPGPRQVRTWGAASGVRDGHHVRHRMVRLLGRRQGAETAEGPPAAPVHGAPGGLGVPAPDDGWTG